MASTCWRPGALVLASLLLTDPFLLFSQTSVAIAPEFGLASLQSYVLVDANDDFKAYNRKFTPVFGLKVQVDVNHNWQFYSSWATYQPIISWKFRDSGPNQARMNSTPANRFSVGMQKTVWSHRWMKNSTENEVLNYLMAEKRPIENRYLFLFRSRIVSGVSYDIFSGIPGNLMSSGHNTSIFFGLALQFFDGERDRLQFNVVYSQGIDEVTEYEVTHYYKNNPYDAILGSRGSLISVQVCYPIVLYSSR